MKRCIGAGVLLLAIVPCRAATARRANAEDVFQLVSAAVAVGGADDEIARQLENLKPTERFSGDIVEVLKSQGAEPRTLHALDELRAQSANLPSPALPVVVVDAGFQPEQRKELLAKIAEYASGYLSALPNLSCSETTRFSSNGHESGLRGERKAAKMADGWRLEDTVVEDLDYYDGTETYHTRKLNGAPETRPITQIRGAFSRGELGSNLAITFAPESQAEFQWDHWENLHGRRIAALRFSIDRAHSQYWVCCVATGSMTVNGVTRQRYKKWISAYRGFVYADAGTGNIVRFTFRNVDIPAEYNLQDARGVVEYSTVTLSGKSFLVPAKAIHYSRTAKGRMRDEIVFSNYRAFGADSTLSFPAEGK
jgi:hypothetical protein